MQVFLDLSYFRGVGDVPANDLETFIRVLKKFRGVDERYVKSSYYYVLNDNKLQAEIKMSLDRETIDDIQYAALVQAEADEKAATERRYAAQLATDVADIIATAGTDQLDRFKVLIAHLHSQNRLYYKENDSALLTKANAEIGVYFTATSSQGNVRHHYVDTLGNWSATEDPV